MDVILQASPIVSDGPAWFAAIGIVSTMIVSLFKEYMPIIGKKIDVEKYVVEIKELKNTIDKQQKDILLLSQQLTESRTSLSQVEGWFFAMKKQLEDMGASDIVDLINKRNDEGNT